MPLPWFRILDAVIGITDFARTRNARAAAAAAAEPDGEQLSTGSRALGHIETRLAGVVVAALKEAFDRDARRLELEREQLEAERLRAERVLRMELLRQAGDREITRLRMMAGVAVVSWLGTMFLATMLDGSGVASRVLLGVAWVLLLTSLALAFAGQSSVARALSRIEQGTVHQDDMTSSVPGMLAPWLIVVGLALAGAAVLAA